MDLKSGALLVPPSVKNSSCSHPRYSSHNFIIHIGIAETIEALLIVILTLGVIGANCLVIFVINNRRYSPFIHQQPRYLLTSLALNDLTIGLLITPFSVLPALFHCWPYGEIFCQIQALLRGALSQQSAVILVCMAVDRYICALHPRRYYKHSSKKGCVAILSVTWIISLTIFGFLVLPKGYYFNQTGLMACEPFYSKPSYRILSTCALYFPTTMVLMYCYGSSFHMSRYRLNDPTMPLTAHHHLHGHPQPHHQHGVLQQHQHHPHHLHHHLQQQQQHLHPHHTTLGHLHHPHAHSHLHSHSHAMTPTSTGTTTTTTTTNVATPSSIGGIGSANISTSTNSSGNNTSSNGGNEGNDNTSGIGGPSSIPGHTTLTNTSAMNLSMAMNFGIGMTSGLSCGSKNMITKKIVPIQEKNSCGSTSRSMAAISLGFIVMVTPWTIQEIVTACTGSKLPPFLDFLVTWTALSNSLWNPFMYWLLNSDFRRLSRQLLPSRCSSRSSTDSSEQKSPCCHINNTDFEITTLPMPPEPPTSRPPHSSSGGTFPSGIGGGGGGSVLGICARSRANSLSRTASQHIRGQHHSHGYHGYSGNVRPDIESLSEKYWGEILERTVSANSLHAMQKTLPHTHHHVHHIHHQLQTQPQHHIPTTITTSFSKHSDLNLNLAGHAIENAIPEQSPNGGIEYDLSKFSNSEPKLCEHNIYHDVNCAKNKSSLLAATGHTIETKMGHSIPDI